MKGRFVSGDMNLAVLGCCELVVVFVRRERDKSDQTNGCLIHHADVVKPNKCVTLDQVAWHARERGKY